MSQQLVSGSGGALIAPSLAQINANFTALFGALFAVGNVYYLDPVHGSDTSGTGGAAKPYATLAVAYAACADGNNDVVVLVGNGQTSGTARVDTAFTWAKNATHLVGWCSPILFSQRARIAPTSTTTAFTPFFTISGSGCIFQNVQWFHGFATGTTAQINMVLTGQRNYFKNCAIDGMGDTTSATDAGSRSLKIGGGGAGENVFDSCSIGLDTVTRTGANASVEFTGNAVRNAFLNCLFPAYGGAGGAPLIILGTGAACVDRFNEFAYCKFRNAIKSGATAMTTLGSFTSASPGGMITFTGCNAVGMTKYGDTNFLANSFVDMAAVSGSAGGLMVAPS